MPSLATQDRVEGGSGGGHRATRQGPQNDGVVAFFVLGILGDLPIGWIAEPRHQLVVLFLCAIFFLLETVEDDVWIRDSLKPGKPALDFLAIGCSSGCLGDALGPASGVVVFLFSESKQDVFSFDVALAIGQMFVRRGRLDLAPPHFLDGRQVCFVDGHRAVA
jgi:hypothetical protein